MRIIIESDDRERVETSAHVPTEPGPIETIDGGAPSEMLIQAVAGTLPIPTEIGPAREGVDGGTPPEWLLEAIQGARQTRIEGLSADTNAGSAPSEG